MTWKPRPHEGPINFSLPSRGVKVCRVLATTIASEVRHAVMSVHLWGVRLVSCRPPIVSVTAVAD